MAKTKKGQGRPVRGDRAPAKPEGADGLRVKPEGADGLRVKPARTPVPPIARSVPALPTEAGTVTVTAILALMMFFAPAAGATSELMLQDTLKSIIVSFAALAAALLLFWQTRTRVAALRWHGVIWLPLALMAYALGSMAWSHTYLGGVEAIRWFVFSLIVWVGLNNLSRERLPLLAWGIHLGALVASLWTALQFWIEFAYFPQGPHPASTFVNRNFFAEFAVCCLPFSMVLLARARQSAVITFLATSAGFIATAILMTGTRSALIALWLQALVVFPAIAWYCRGQFAFPTWSRGLRVLAVGLLVGTVLGLGSIPTGDPAIAQEGRGMTAIERGLKRTESISPNDPSLGLRMVMWRATLNLISRRPLSGVGAGAWESDIPLYQAERSQLETDYYVHNEFLQLVAEYGVVGWAFLAGLAAWLLVAAWRTWIAATDSQKTSQRAEAPWRAVFLSSLLALMIVSNVGFPWRMAATGALFALCLAGIAASDARMGFLQWWSARRIAWHPVLAPSLLVAGLGCTALAVYISQQAAESERKIVMATKIALSISASGDPNNPRWQSNKAQMLQLIREGIALNPHYRKITPMVADELARWGDWADALWIWESVLSSRPNVVAIIANIARAHVSLGDLDAAQRDLRHAMRIQPDAPAVRSLEVILLSRTGKEAQALARCRQSIGEGIYDYDLANAAFVLADRAGDFNFADQALRLRLRDWPGDAAAGWMQLGEMWARRAGTPDRALAAYRNALAAASAQQREALLLQMPAAYAAQLQTARMPSGRPRPVP
jgi:O-antigen ligase